MDLRGHGDSDWDPERRYDTETLTGDLAKVIAALGLQTAILVGHSLGAAVAIRFAADNPDRVSALIIVDFGPELEELGVNEVLRGFVDVPRTFSSVEEYAQWLTARRPLADPNQLRQLARCTLRQSPLQHWELKIDPALVTGSQIGRLPASQGRYRDPELWTALGRIKCPTLVIRGSGSGVLPQDVASRMVEGMLVSDLATIEAAGHDVIMDNPDGFSSCVKGFLSPLVARSRSGERFRSLRHIHH
jgi:pimeloyl-ACP methyl ester carboxylesterase